VRPVSIQELLTLAMITVTLRCSDATIAIGPFKRQLECQAKPRTIIVVEDEPAGRLVMCEYLREKHGLQ